MFTIQAFYSIYIIVSSSIAHSIAPTVYLKSKARVVILGKHFSATARFSM